MALPASGSLSIKGAAGVGRSISQEVDGNETGNKSLATLSTSAGKSAPHGMIEFYSYTSVVVAPGPVSNVTTNNINPFGIEVGWDAPSTGGSPTNYRVEMSEDGGPFSLYDNNGTSVTITILNSDLTVGLDYQFRIRAENSAGNSTYTTSSSIIY